MKKKDHCENTASNASRCEYEYAAFISYRHLSRDQDVACAVQRAIERFRLPRGVDATELNQVERRSAGSLGRCFRDEDELSAAHSLPDRIHDALARSSSLIVICTPETKESAWVQREIAEYIELHGRERVIAVLAAGSSEESIPDILRSRPSIDSDGSISEVRAEPLAADLRPAKARKTRDELLRVIAAVAGCGYDDLKQRQAKRTKRRMLVGGIGALVLVIAFAALAWGLYASTEAFKVSESKELAVRSYQELEEGDRMQAIEIALAALPSSSTDASRPLVPEAEAALKAAIQIDPDPYDAWRPSYILTTSSDIVSFVSSETGQWAAVLDESDTVNVFDLVSGKSVSSFDLSKHGASPYDADDVASSAWELEVGGESEALLFARDEINMLICIDVLTGQEKWSYDDIVVSSLAVSEDGSSAAIFSIVDDSTLAAFVLDLNTGAIVQYAEFDNPSVSAAPYTYPSVYDAVDQRAYLAVAGFVFTVDFTTGTFDGAQVNDQLICSLEDGDGSLVTASAMMDESVEREGLVEWSVASISDQCTLWEESGTYEVEIISDGGEPTIAFGETRVRGFISYDGPAVVVTAGDQLKVLCASDGKELFSRDMGSVIVGCGSAFCDDDHDLLYVATAAGDLEVLMPSIKHMDGDVFRTRTPHPVDSASIEWYAGGDCLALLKGASSSKELLVYRLDARAELESVDVSLDQLISLGNEILAANRTGEGNLALVNDPAQSAS